MSNRYTKWTRLTNPPGGVITNSLVNHNAGIVITQNSGLSPLHNLVSSSITGKEFTVANSDASTFNVTIRANTETGLTSFSIAPGDSAVFRWIGSIWEETSGEAIIRSLSSASATNFLALTDTPPPGSYAGSAGQFVRINAGETGLEFAPVSGPATTGQVNRTILFSDGPDAAPGTFNIGAPLPGNARITTVTVAVSQAFNDVAVTDLTVNAAAGGLVLLQNSNANDIKSAGTYLSELPMQQTSSGQITANFNADPNGTGGTTGNLTVTVEYVLI